MTEKHQLLTDQELENNFKTCKLSPVLFTHEAHLRLAYIHLNKYDKTEAIDTICTQLATFDRLCGSGTKFNRELTVIGMEIVDECMQQINPRTFRDLICACPELKENFKALVRKKTQANPLQTLSKEGMKRSVQFS